MRLLERGYTVRATVRDPTNRKKVKHLLDLLKAETHLTLWKADLADEGSFDEAIQGCTGVFHVATPMDFEPKDPENEVIKPTINGLLDILKASGTVIMEEHKKPVYNESNWSDVEFCCSVKMTGWMCFVSKTLAEQAAWKYAKENNIDFITIVPTLVIGPFLTPSIPPSLITGLSPITRTKSHYGIINQGQYVHLGDLCLSHIYLYEHLKAEGRYICLSHDAKIHDLVKMLREKYPTYNISTKFEGIDDNLDTIHFSSKKLRHIGFEFKYSLEDMFVEAVDTCRAKGLIFIPAEKTEAADESNVVDVKIAG
ncbi:bifunctional dihydroflavonol 4-reductase/flavanone 4-reductase-like [Pyrus ussuriensis x Pyrus communis]|uniref:Bifunctional dihydroflavonol 4-reductase/flavanone 4-reductase n=1 Tax=Pyrus ussuriensis x Pyrus communis TaxID=2448454 RepID=A0A5N5HKG5_9ROSA|nr:bifunctional dihydroflavonol 4-reductase/flavanone 4-reductase-like [Pyrus ussuriensis x Pyrus communis]